MVELILARHGETDWNAAEVFRGRADVDLNRNGIEQAELLGEYLGNKKVDFVYSSPLKRALQTARAVAGRQGLEVISIPGLADFDFGEWQGLSHPEVQGKYPALYRDWIERPAEVRISGGESLQDVRERAVPFAQETVMKCGEGRIVMVSHRVVNKVLICALLGLGNDRFWNIRQDTCGITCFTWEAGRFVLAAHNDTSFLKPLRQTSLTDF